MTTRWRWSPRRKWAPAAWPTRCAISAVIGASLVRPRMPSVPKYLRVMGGFIAVPPTPFHCDGPPATPPSMSQAARILAALATGLILGILSAGHDWAPRAAERVEPIGQLWLAGLEMTIVPL